LNVKTPQNKQMEDSQSSEEKELEKIQILIAESDNELVSLFETYLSLLGMNIKTASSGEKALDCFLDSKKKDRPYDAIIVDTHLSNPSGLDVVKRIRNEKPDQKIVLVTTTPTEYLPAECLVTAGIKDRDILTMPFRMTKLETALSN
jgi:two-component system, OmpR family, response regulator